MRAQPIVLCALALACTTSPQAHVSTSPTPNPSGSPEATPTASSTATATPTPGPYVVDPSTLTGKVMFGYQGWFACPGDGSPPGRWVHWFRNDTADAQNVTIDYWPDTTELGTDERCETEMTLPGGAAATLYSAWNPDTIDRHFAWMAEHDLDGVFLQRFTSDLLDPAFFTLRNQVATNVVAGAEAHQRVFAIMYDISGHPESTLVEDVKADWMYLVDTLGILESPRYLHHEGKPVLGLWGLGFNDRPGTPAQAAELIDWLTTSAPEKYRVTLVGGVPTWWRTLQGDSKTDPAWAAIYRSYDVVSPWAVGRYADESGADAFREQHIEPDLTDTSDAGVGYMPVIFPGFSWHNLNDGPVNQIPRNGGELYWRQAFNAVDAGVDMIFVAMFDEVDEGTAMYKLAPTVADLPEQGAFVSLDADGDALPSDWYLQLGDATGRMLRGEIEPTPQIPVSN